MRGPLRAASALALGLGALVGAGCVETFDGSKVEILFLRGTQIPEGEPTMVGPVAVNPEGRPPQGTHYEMYIVTDEEGVRPFHLKNFLLTPIVDIENPCYIESNEAIYPVYEGEERPIGLHTSQWREKLLELYMEDGTVTDPEAGSIADAIEREGAIDSLHEQVKAVVSHQFGLGTDPTLYDRFQDDYAALVASLPDEEATDPASNLDRYNKCHAFFDLYPDWYVGFDRVITIPINGDFIGVGDGQDPRNLGFIGGADFNIERKVPSYMTAMRINWQFDDPEDPRAEGYGGRAPFGYHYMAGLPEYRTRRIINVQLKNEVYTGIAAQSAIILPLDEDEVQF